VMCVRVIRRFVNCRLDFKQAGTVMLFSTKAYCTRCYLSEWPSVFVIRQCRIN